ncbi:hypothetical protein I316_04972 [Kwoniella heveanensis BCC8398]|uniref:Large ribosomal subunit protein mL46 n=1 Tax=Kwoniella heveanensis BCC8398 TaxID=1296120 RepID=A0A1B9GQF0_9TREE|nr:hypothetical protein I316_04972 [Kwoniella heveanensis BCC8398]
MSFVPRSIARASASAPRRATALRQFSSNPSTSAAPPPLIASLLLSRAPLLTPTPTELESTYHEHSRAVSHALSSPLPLDFYFKSGSLPLRRHLRAEHEYVKSIYGPRLAGSAPDVGDIPPETEYETTSRDHWEKTDGAQRGEKSLERFPEEEVYCLVRRGEKWVFPQTEVGKLEGLDEAVTRGLTGVEGSLGGKGMDSWIVTRKPVGVVKNGEQRTFFLKGHILAGQPTLSSASGYTSFAWLNASEVEIRLKEQGDEKLWDEIKGIFGVAEDAQAEVEAEV